MSQQERCPTGVVTIRNKVTEKQAIQLTWQNWNAICDFVTKPWFVRGVWLDKDGNPLPEDQWRFGENNDDLGLIIRTLESNEFLAKGNDWIIRGLNGEFYACKPDIFEKSYEIVSGNDSAPSSVAEQPVPSGKQDEREMEIRAKWEKACEMCAALCQPRGSVGSREWMMSIPVRMDDPDVVITDALDCIPVLLYLLDAERKRVQELEGAWRSCKHDPPPNRDSILVWDGKTVIFARYETHVQQTADYYYVGGGLIHRPMLWKSIVPPTVAEAESLLSKEQK